MKKLMAFLVGVFIFIAVIVLAKNVIAKAAIETGVEFVTGLSLKMGSFEFHLRDGFVGIKDLRLSNPSGFHDKTMVDMPEIALAYDLPALIKGKMHIEEIRIHLKEFVVIKNEKGELNLDKLKAIGKQEKKAEKPAEPAKKGKAPAIHIDQLKLHIEKVVFRDYSGGGAEPSVKEFNININEQYQNIQDLNALISIIVVKALTNTTIASLTNFDVTNLKGSLADTLGSSTKIAAFAGDKVSGTLKNYSQQAGVEGVTEDLESAAKQGAEKIKGMFGSLKKSIE